LEGSGGILLSVTSNMGKEICESKFLKTPFDKNHDKVIMLQKIMIKRGSNNMAPTIRVDDEVLAELRKIGVPYIDTPNSVLRKLLKLEDGKKPVIKEEVKIKNEIPGKAHFGEVQTNPSSVTYSHPRLCFKASYIEPLNENDVFEVVTAHDGTFRFTKADFYRVFPNVIRSVSYREDGIYHYPKVPKKKALPFKIN